jgi:hypothetical protein
MATSVRLYQRLNTEGFPLIPVPYSRNGSPIADKNATAFYLRYRAGGKRHWHSSRSKCARSGMLSAKCLRPGS